MLDGQNCAGWEYEHHKRYASVKLRSERLERLVDRGNARIASHSFDTRPAHRYIFRKAAPDACRCLAGGYRGSHECVALQTYPPVTVVGKHGDPRVGYAPGAVAFGMSLIDKALQRIPSDWAVFAGVPRPPNELKGQFVMILADVMELFLTIHPYANGNGHTARMLFFVGARRLGLTTKNWTIHGKQGYGQALSHYRSGNKIPLIKFLRACIV